MTKLLRILFSVLIFSCCALESVWGFGHEKDKRHLEPAATSRQFHSQTKSIAKSSPDEDLSLDEHYAKGLTSYYDGDFGTALKIFTKLQKAVDNARLDHLSALCQYRLGNVSGARKALTGLLKKAPNHHAARISLIKLYSNNSDFAAAARQMRHLEDASIDEDYQLLMDRLKLRIGAKGQKSRHYLSVEQGIRWNSNINAGSNKSVITAPNGKVFRLDEKDRAIDDWGATTHLYCWYRYDPKSYLSWFWDTSASLYHLDYFENDDYDYTSMRLKTGPVWKRKPHLLSLPAGYRISLENGHKAYQEISIHPIYKYTFNKRWAIKGDFYYGDRSYEDPSDSAMDKVVQRINLQPILNIKKTSISASFGWLSASASDPRYDYQGVDASLYARHKLTDRTSLSVRYKHLIKNYQRVYTGWFEKRKDSKHSVNTLVTRKIGKNGSLGLSMSWSQNHSNTELFEYDRFTAGLNFALKF